MKRLVTLLFFLTSTAFAADLTYRTLKAAPDNDATVVMNGKLQRIVFEPAAIRVGVTLQSGTTKTSHAWPADWVRNVHFAITDDATHQSAEVRAEVIRQEDELIRVQEHGVDHSVYAEFRLAPLSRGSYFITTSYDGLSQTTPHPLWVVRGDETPQVRDWWLQRQIEKSKTWEETKRLLFARIEINPRNAAAWFTLAAGGEQHEDYETTKGYYEKAMEIWQQIGGPDAEETIRGVKRTLELLPAYYADREHLVIIRENFGPGTPTRIELRERKPRVYRTPEKN